MMAPKSPASTCDLFCPVKATLDLLNSKWTLHILRELMAGKRRFNELSRSLGLSSRTLCSRLRGLEEQGILVREIKNTIPPWVEYELTDKGQALNEVLECIVRWGVTYMCEEVSVDLLPSGLERDPDPRVPSMGPWRAGGA